MSDLKQFIKTTIREFLNEHRVTIGEFTYVELQNINDEKYKAKIDTGADTCSIHSTYQKEENGILSYKLLNKSEIFKTNDFEKIDVKTSNGDSSYRYKVKLNLKIKDKKYKTNFTLNDRSYMTTPILLGKNLIKNKFIVKI